MVVQFRNTLNDVMRREEKKRKRRRKKVRENNEVNGTRKLRNVLRFEIF